MTDLLEHRLIFVTGKGGTGKTTTAAALALLAAEAGRRVLVCEAEARGGLSGAFECAPTRYEPREIVPRLFAMTMDSEAALREYLRLNFKIPSAFRLGPLDQLLDLAVGALPGVREVLAIGKLCYEVREGRYDLVIVDAHATGSVIRYLTAPTGVYDVVRTGGVREETRWMLEILSDPTRTTVVAVTTPEETPVLETLELVDNLGRETTVAIGAVVANRVPPELFSRADEAAFAALCEPDSRSVITAEVGEGLEDVFATALLARDLRNGATEHLDRLRHSIRADVAVLYVPLLFGRADGPRAVRQVAQALDEEFGA